MEDKNNLVNFFVNYYNPKNSSDEAIENRKYYSSNKAKDYIAMNMSFNMLGVGNAATPTGIKAFNELQDGSDKITATMVMLLVINATSIQLLPTTIIGMRVTAGSGNASDIIMPSLIATLVSTIVGIVLVKLFYSFKKQKALPSSRSAR